jgi:hypothetical protein
MKSLIAAAAIALAAATSAFADDAGVKIGVLTCDIEGGFGFIIGSAKGADCTFKGAKGRVEKYDGSLGRLGVDIGITGEKRLAWIVFAPGKIKPNGLQGNYAGISAEATAGVGLGANVLVGGFRKTINLQPISVSGQTGLNVAAGVANLSLRAAE